MKNIFRYFITAIFAVAVFGSLGAVESNAQSIMRDILKRMDSHYKALQTLNSSVSRRQANPQIGTSDSQSGTLIMVPGKARDDASVRLNWTKPREETLLIYKGRYQLYVPGIQTSYEGSTKSQKAGSGGGGVLRMMSMSEAELKANYETAYEGKETLGGKEVWHIKLTPKTKQEFSYAELWIDMDGMPMQAKVVMANGETDTIQLSSVKKNEKIDKSTFSKIATPSGTKVLKQ